MRNFLLFFMLMYVIFGCEDHEYKSKRDTEQENPNLPPDEGDTILRDGYYRYTDTYSTPKGKVSITLNLPENYDSIYSYEQSSCIDTWEEIVISNHLFKKPHHKAYFAEPLYEDDSLCHINIRVDTLYKSFKSHDTLLDQQLESQKATYEAINADTNNISLEKKNFNHLAGLYIVQIDTAQKSEIQKSYYGIQFKFTFDQYFVNISSTFIGKSLSKPASEFETIMKSIRFKKLPTTQ